MLFLSITSFDALASPFLQESAAISDLARGVELRLDLFPKIDLEELNGFLKTKKWPALFTLRKGSQGGGFSQSEQAREEQIERLLSLKPDFFDLEADMRPEFIKTAIQKHPDTRVILSHHNFLKTPDDLSHIYQKMAEYNAFHYKMAFMALSSNDTMRMLLFAKKHSNLSVIPMGEKGAFGRVLGPIVGNLLGYTSDNHSSTTAPGQIPWENLVSIYRYPTLNPKTAIYGLIGDPVIQSPGDRYHNQIFEQRKIDAVYVKIPLPLEDLPQFVPMAKALAIRGLSVTIPLKEAIVSYLDEIDEKVKPIGSINTLRFHNDRIAGTNTDGVGALDAIEKQVPVLGKRVVILGAGGTARSIAFEAGRRGATVSILNRTEERAHLVAEHLKLHGIVCHSGKLTDLPTSYDILINCSPDALPIPADRICPKLLAMDVVYFPKETLFLQAASSHGCRIVYGEEMFRNQAARQTAFWLSS